MDIDIDQEISKAHLNAAGWDLVNYSDSTPFDSVVFYIVDFSLGLVKLILFNQLKFDEIKSFPMVSLVGSISERILNWSNNRLSISQQGALCYELNCYLHETQTLALYKQNYVSNDGVKNLHVGFNLYRQNKSSKLSMRPFIIGNDCRIRSTNEIVDVARHVRSLDATNRPEDQQLVKDLININ
ncbi:hypothetical protein HNW13_018385 [Shewanella sp. BF02_Schw]|uniref:hypothetical protein n=1 Tax=Shewanella sp. BF02_Schw TaxID=394908 RepID=UPI0017863F49|nr:hypothetical protein [Shewanella sp. BF02_Schw]MBO1897710.1 hypothetical protein [Shewanella sp. BF02_Schw]